MGDSGWLDRRIARPEEEGRLSLVWFSRWTNYACKARQRGIGLTTLVTHADCSLWIVNEGGLVSGKIVS